MRAYRRQYNATNASKRHIEMAARRRAAKEYVDRIKGGTPCADCGRSFAAIAMDFDHVRGAKARSVSSLVSGAYKIDLIQDEIAKCDVVCACCHRIRTAARKENLSPPRPRAVWPVKSMSNRKEVTYEGETHSVSEWAHKLGISSQTVSYRLRRGYPVEKALSVKGFNVGTSPVWAPRRGIETPNAKLNETVVRAIRADYLTGMSQDRIAEKHGTSQSNVSAILKRQIWSHVE